MALWKMWNKKDRRQASIVLLKLRRWISSQKLIFHFVILKTVTAEKCKFSQHKIFLEE